MTLGSSVCHVVIVAKDVLLNLINSILYLIRHIYGDRYGCVFTEVLTQIGKLHISWMLPPRIVLKQVEWQHLPPKCFSIWIIFERPLHNWTKSEVRCLFFLDIPLLGIKVIRILGSQELKIIFVVKQLLDNIKIPFNFVVKGIIFWIEQCTVFLCPNLCGISLRKDIRGCPMATKPIVLPLGIWPVV